MSFEQDAELISSYNEWAIQRRAMANDVSPQAFLEDRMKQDAAERVLKAIEHIETLGEWVESSGGYRNTSPDDQHMRRVELILRGTV